MIKIRKVFENISQYQLIKKEEWIENFNKEIEFTKIEIDTINKCGKFFKREEMFGRPYLFDGNESMIYKYEDEWYIYRTGNKLQTDLFWKCDQFDGLIKCIEDLLAFYTAARWPGYY